MFHSNTIGSNSAAWTVIVTDTLEISSGTNVTVGPRLQGPQPIRRPTLVE